MRAGLYGSHKCSSCNATKHGKYLKKYYCIDCNKEISDFHHIRCHSCETKRKFKEGILLHIPIIYCQDCGKDLGKWAYHNESQRCLSCANKGINNPNYVHGNCYEPYPLGWTKIFKEQIRFRDNYKCQICGCHEVENCRRLDIHHINYDKENIEPNNLISLCRKCHAKTNFNREHWKSYFAEVINGKIKERQTKKEIKENS
jgi:hypothetical protein